MAYIDDRLAKLEGSIGPPSDGAPAARIRADLNRLAEIISSSRGDHFANTLARVGELRPELSAFDQQLEAKRLIVCEEPGGTELWERLAALRDRALRDRP